MKGSSKRPQPDTAPLRKFILEVLPADSDLDGFCMDHFRSTFDKFAGGFDRTQKLNLLLQREDADAIVQSLQKQEPVRFERFRHLLDEGADAEGNRKRAAPSRLSKPSETSSSAAQPSRPAPDKTPSPSHEATVTILHVSDMQFGRNHRFGRLGLGGEDEKFDTLLKRLTDDLDKLQDEHGLKPDLVALTGDLAEWGLKKEYEDVFAFCVGLQEHLKLARDRILIIPGNHDINRKLCEAYFAACEGEGEKPIEPYWPKWKPYVDFFGKLYRDVARYDFKETAPYTWFEIPELKVVVAGLNSTMRESHKEKDPSDPNSKYGHYGYVGEAQLDWFKGKLAEAEKKGWLRIGLVHHNALRGAVDDDENLRDAPLLKERIGSKLNLLLHGHTHNGSLEWLGRDLPVISTGSAAVKAEQRPEEVPNQYQIIQVRRDGFTSWARQYLPGRRAWIGDTRVSSDGHDWRHDEKLGLPHTHATFGTGKPELPSTEGVAVITTIEVPLPTAPLPTPAEKPPGSQSGGGQPRSSAALDKLRRELRKLLLDAPELTVALVSERLGEAGLLGDKQVDSVCSALLGGRIYDVTRTLAKLARDPEQGSRASLVLCLVLPLAVDLETVLGPSAATAHASQTLVLSLRTATLAEVAMARMDGRRAEFVPGGLYLQGLRRILMPAVAYSSLIDPEGRALADALVRSLRTECHVDGTTIPDAAAWRKIQAEHPSEKGFQQGVLDQLETDADTNESRYLLFIDDELDSEGHASGDAALDALWQTVRDKLPAVLPGLRVVRLTFRMTGQSPPAVEDETKVARIIGKALGPQ